MALCISLILLMFGKEIRLCFVASWLVGVWNGFLLEKVGRHPAHCRFCGALDGPKVALSFVCVFSSG